MHAICIEVKPSLKNMLMMSVPKAVAMKPKKTDDEVLFLLTSC